MLLQFSPVKERLPKYEYSDYIINLMMFFFSFGSISVAYIHVSCVLRKEKVEGKMGVSGYL